MLFIVFEDYSGRPLAFIVSYACHNNCVSGAYTGDLGGRIGDALREALDVAIPTLFVEAPCGDVVWFPPQGCSGGDTLAREIGRAAAKSIIQEYNSSL